MGCRKLFIVYLECLCWYAAAVLAAEGAKHVDWSWCLFEKKSKLRKKFFFTFKMWEFSKISLISVEIAKYFDVLVGILRDVRRKFWWHFVVWSSGTNKFKCLFIVYRDLIICCLGVWNLPKLYRDIWQRCSRANTLGCLVSDLTKQTQWVWLSLLNADHDVAMKVAVIWRVLYCFVLMQQVFRVTFNMLTLYLFCKLYSLFVFANFFGLFNVT